MSIVSLYLQKRSFTSPSNAPLPTRRQRLTFERQALSRVSRPESIQHQ